MQGVFRKIGVSLALAAGLVLVMPVFSLAQSTSPLASPTGSGSNEGGVVTTDIDVEQGYQNIMTQGIIFANMPGDREACRNYGQCSLEQVMQIFVNICIFILGISGSIILGMFVWGGFIWVFSRGKADQVQKGKDTMVNAVFGLAIILGSYAMVNFVIAALAGVSPNGTIEETIDAAGKADGTP